MEDSKQNKRIQDAVGSGLRKTASAVRGAAGRLRLWQKIGLLLCLVFWILSALIGAVCARITSNMKDQTFASRWWNEEDCAQVSAYFSESAAGSEEMDKQLRAAFATKLQTDSIVLSDTQIANGASLYDVCYCGIGNMEISAGTESVSVTAIGVGGDFFNFHPLDLMSGYYFSEEELMKDRVLLDDETAWRLFGSPDIVGQEVEIGGTPHYVAGVFRRPEGRFYKSSGMGSYLVYISYDSLCKYTQTGGAREENSENSDEMGDDTVNMDAAADPLHFLTRILSAGTAVNEKGQGRTRISPRSPVTAAMPVAAAWKPVLDRVFLSSLDDSDLSDLEGLEDVDASDSEEADDGEDEGSLTDGPLESSSGNPQGTSSADYSSLDSGEGKAEVNRSRIICYEVILPNPVVSYAVRAVRSCMTQAEIPSDQMTIVENTSRFDPYRLALMMAEPGVRSMQTAAIRYPYWENVALAWEDLLVPFALLQLVLRFSPILFLLFMLIWYATHKSWTVGGVISDVQGRIYDRQSERIYGKKNEGSLPDGSGAAPPLDLRHEGQEEGILSEKDPEEKPALPDGQDGGREAAD